MDRKRNVINEIQLKRLRANYATKYDFSTRFFEIQGFIESIDEESQAGKEALRYIPLGSIAATETFFRLVYQDIIDLGDPYLSRVVKHLKEKGNIKFDFEYLVALHGKQVSIGELFAHQLPLNNLQDIQTVMNMLLGADFFTLLKCAKLSEDFSLVDEAKEFKKDFGMYVTAIKKLFELRHILAHEFASSIKLDKQQLSGDFNKLMYFNEATRYLVDKLTNRYTGVTNTEIISHLYRRFRKVEKELNSLIKEIKFKSKKVRVEEFNVRTYNKAIEKWKEFRSLYSHAHTLEYDGGAFQEIFRLTHMEEVTRGMVENLKEWNRELFRGGFDYFFHRPEDRKQ